MHRLPIATCLALATLAFVSSRVEAATRVPLVLDELRKDRSVPWPVTTGVPFAKGALKNADQCRLVDDQGREQSLQAKVAATWDAKKSSIRWLTIDFIARPGRSYALEFGDEVSRRPASNALAIRDDAELAIATGPMRVVFSRTAPAALKSVQIDLDGDGTIADDELVAGGSASGDHFYIDAHDRVSNSARDATDRVITLESRGPVRACIRVDGWYSGPDGERIVGYRTRYHLFAGLPIIKVIDEFRIIGSTRETHFRDIALPLKLHLSQGGLRATASIGEGTPQTRDLDGKSTSVSLRQETYRHYGNQECRAVWETRPGDTKPTVAPQAGPWLQVCDERAAVTGSLRWFWQQFPKEWEASADQLTLHLWSPRVPPLDFGKAGLQDFFGPAGNQYLLDWQGTRTPRTPIENFFYFAGRHALERDGADGRGINKHHEVWYHFGRADEAAAGREYGDLADRQPLCLATGAWNVGTDVFGPLASRPNDSPYEAIVDRLFGFERYAQDHFGDYGWWLFGAGPHYSYQWDPQQQRHYADPRRFEYHTYQRETQLWWNYFRSGERKFFDWAIPSENHWVDIAVSHVPTKYSTQWRGGTAQEATLHYAAGDWSIDSPLHYVRHHDTGEAWLRSVPQFWATYHRTLETTTLAYYLTGDERYHDVIDFWRIYWGGLAGVRSDTGDLPIWYREQLWWKPTAPGEPSRTWAQMLRDYAPFQSGSRHQMTLLFNLSTLFEHTWDERIGKAVREYADAFLDPTAPNGVWQCQDHRLPANADSPMLAHYWAPALWKYARATQDPRMPIVLQKYFNACIEADPYGEDVGIYSNNQIAWAWYFTKDPRHLAAAAHELESLLPHAAPLAKPEDLGRRIYNPYAPIKALAAVPRLVGILEDAKKQNIAVPERPPLTPQRTWIALQQAPGQPLEGVLWGWDSQPQWRDEQGAICGAITSTAVHRSHRRPFDRVLPNYQVYRQEFRLPPAASAEWRFCSPKLETGILRLSNHDVPVWCWAGEPVRIEPRQPWYWRRTGSGSALVIESAQPAALAFQYEGQTLSAQTLKNRATVSLEGVPSNGVITITTPGERDAWFRMVEQPAAACWVTPDAPENHPSPPAPPNDGKTASSLPDFNIADTFVPGRFGGGLFMSPGRVLQIPNEVVDEQGKSHALCDAKQGTIEFWIRRRWDERLTPISAAPLLTAGSVYVPLPSDLPYDDWAHVAVVWHPIPNDETQRSLVHVYVNGVDYGNYRSIYWQGYSQPPTFSPHKELLKQFTLRPSANMPFVIDDLRISRTPRYLDLSLDFGRSQTFNPQAFEVPTAGLGRDDATTLQMTFDGDLRVQTGMKGQQAFEATLTTK